MHRNAPAPTNLPTRPMNPGHDAGPPGPTSGAAAAKRSRVPLSCGPCRASKLGCDRAAPCGQCLRKSRPESCVYVPKPEKKRPPKGMAARLRQLEGMVRTMMDDGVVPAPSCTSSSIATGARVEEVGVAQPGGQLVRGERASTYVGATHFMAVLEDVSHTLRSAGSPVVRLPPLRTFTFDEGKGERERGEQIEDIKSYLEEAELDDDESPGPSGELEAPDLIFSSGSAPRSREDLMRLIPDRKIVDRLVMRYFSSQNPSQHIVHRPTFVKQYAQFWADPPSVPIHWLALIFMIMSIGVFYSTVTAPHELVSDSPEPPVDRIKVFRAAAAWCLVLGRYTQPSIATIPPFILYVESEFAIARAAQTNCYVLSSVCLRLLLKMGMHRDPDRLAGISPFEGEMRRRMWNMAVQLDLLVSFHMGLPSMFSGIDSDCELPRNLVDEDFGEDSAALPPPRPPTDYTEMTYPINKSCLMRVFGQIARQAHLLAPPPYREVMRLDGLLGEAWARVPQFMRVQPLEQCVTTPAVQIVQRFGLASLYNKSRCVLHRRFLLEPLPRREHDHSRRQCLEGAIALLDFQNTIWQASRPGHMLSQHGWYVSSLAVHDFLLAAIILYLAVGNRQFWDVGVEHEWMAGMSPPPTRGRLLHLLQRSYSVWASIATDVPELRKTAGILETMLGKLGSPPNSPPKDEAGQALSVSGLREGGGLVSESSSSQDYLLPDNLSIDSPTASSLNTASNFQLFEFMTSGLGPNDYGLDRGWVAVGGNEMDWRYFDNIIAQPNSDPIGLGSLGPLDTDQQWFDRAPAPDDFEFPESGAYGSILGQQG
ncbi:fungal-specific transcription factor domain-containing protein [Colletotrichum navitas]|uniref:Fungal-specific transcription factor domain-containing protein n=1 Tax=Colletotrichum navitas TaxID=681940 RepID=A0AAD8QBD0_9PEZI|nr:fungal-specific transcription factor domain-containing protein [Colletotrichum navitas]KAK1599558.1 fungal-specific transcription factor domain-containing protein [Colletotrichum navitas]